MVKSSSPTSRSRTFIATIHPLAARFNFKPHLSDVTLANILDGDTCAPISLSDFEKYLTFVEYSIEYLQFLVWFQDYRERYLKSFNKFTGFSNNESISEPPGQNKTEERTKMEISDADSPASPSDVVSHTSLSPLLSPVYIQFASPSPPFAASKSHDPKIHGFHRECLRVISTFFTPGSSKELALDAIVRDTVIRNLLLSCHPDVFLPVYEEVYSSLEQCSLPRFLSAASANINLPKQLYWYAFGTVNMLFAILIAVLMITLVPTPPEANRAWRIIPVLIFVVGGGQFYSAWRGSCGQIERRGMTQLRVWEMREMDNETKLFVEGILNQHENPQTQSATAFQEKSQSTEIDLAVIAPFTIEAQQIGGAGRPSVSSDTLPSYVTPPPVAAGLAHDFRRPPIFGSETVVVDPRIKAVHRHIVIEVYRFGLYVLLISSAVVFSIPSRSHPRS